MAVKIDVEFRGVFFTGNPVGRLHRNAYVVQEWAGQEAVKAVQASLYPGHGYLSGDLFDSIAYSPIRAGRGGTSWTGRGKIVQGRRGYEPVRRYGKKIEAKYHHMRRGAAIVRGWVAGNTQRIRIKLVEGLA